LKDILSKIYVKLFTAAASSLRPLVVLIINSNGEPDLKQIISILQNYQDCFQKGKLCSTVVLQFFNQIYYFMDSVMFNKLLQFSSFSGQIGMNLKIVISELIGWKQANLKKYYSTQPNQYISFADICSFEYISQAINVLVLNKTQFVDQTFIENLFPRLSGIHLYILLSRFVPDELAPHEVPTSVLMKLKGDSNEEIVEVDEMLFRSILKKVGNRM